MGNRTDARELGFTHYQGIPCTKDADHAPTRYVSNGACVQCELDKRRSSRNANKAHEAERARAYKLAHPEQVKEAKKRQRVARAARTAPDRQVHAGAVRLDREFAAHDRQAKRVLLDAYLAPIIIAERERRRKERAQEAQSRATTRRQQAKLFRRQVESVYRVENVTTDQIALLRLAHQGRCAYCGSRVKIELDHKTPISRGGLHTYSNLQYLCKIHNRKKGSMTDAEARAKFDIAAETEFDPL